MSLMGFIYTSAYIVLFGLMWNWGKAHGAGSALSSAMSAIY